jgi:hypothetical protein
MFNDRSREISEYRWSDIVECAIGGLTTIFFSISLLSSPLHISPIAGIVMTLVWIALFFIGLMQFYTLETTLKHLFIDYFIVLILSTTLCFLFGIMKWSDIWSYQFLGSTAIVQALLALPAGLIFDIKNIKNVLSNWDSISPIPTLEAAKDKVAGLCRLKHKTESDIKDCIRLNS